MRTNKNILLAILMALCLSVLMTACDDSDEYVDAEEPATLEFYAMDTYMTVSAYGGNGETAVGLAQEEVERIDNMLSTGIEGSEIQTLNSKGHGSVSKETGKLIQRSLKLYKETGGVFDIAVYPIMKAWGFTDKNYRVPSDEELRSLIALDDAADVAISENNDGGYDVSFGKDDMAIDLGGIAKGYTSAQIMKVYKENGVESGLVNLGGNVQVLGTKPDGKKWRVAVQNPNNSDENDYLGVLEAEDIAVITSGAYERNFTKDGKFYHHIIDPKTGYPVENNLKSVTVVSKDGTLADAMATSLFIFGKDKTVDYWHDHQDDFDFISMDKNDELFVSSGIADAFSSENYKVTVVD